MAYCFRRVDRMSSYRTLKTRAVMAALRVVSGSERPNAVFETAKTATRERRRRRSAAVLATYGPLRRVVKTIHRVAICVIVGRVCMCGIAEGDHELRLEVRKWGQCFNK